MVLNERDDIDIKSEVRTQKEFNKLQNEWYAKARRTLKPICLTCVSQDYKNGMLKDFDYYTKDFKKVSESRSMLKEYSSKGEDRVLYVLIDYECRNGHKISFQYRADEYDKLSEQLKKKSKGSSNEK